MDEGVVPGDVGRPPRRPDAAPGDADRLEALEQHVRQLTSRLAGWVEAQLVQALDDRRDDMKALRAELQVVVNEQLAGVRAEASSVLIVTTRRLEVAQEQLSARLDAVAERAADAAARAVALSGTSSTDAERLELLEEQVDQRLALVPDLVKAQVAAAAERQRALVGAARTELEALFDERVADVASASATRVSAIQERLGTMSAGLNARLDDVAGQAAVAADDAEILRAEAAAGPGRVEAFEQRVKAAMGRLTDSVEARLAEVNAGRESELEVLRTGLTERLDSLEQRVAAGMSRLDESLESRVGALSAARDAEVATLRAEDAASSAALARRLDGMTLDTAAVVESVAALRSDAQGGTARLDELEQRVKGAVGRLAESVESRLTELSADRSAELRAELDTTTSALGARFGQVHERIDAVERQSGGAGRIDAMVEAKLTEVVERRRAELESVRSELEEALDTQLRQARTEIGTAVADAHRRFVVTVDELDERMHTVAGQAADAEAAVARFELMEETVSSDGRRIEALEVHTRRTDARLGQVIDEKLAELAGERGADLDGAQRRLRDALDAHLVETRAEVTLALGDGREQLAAGAAALDERHAELDAQATDAAVRLEALVASVEVALSEGEERVAQTMDARLAILDTVAAKVATIDTVAARLATLDDLVARVGRGRTETTAGIAALQRQVAKVQDQVEKRVASVSEQVDALATAAAGEVGTLAPLRSDLHRLQAQVTELAEVVAELRPRRKPPAAPVKKVSAARRRASSQ